MNERFHIIIPKSNGLFEDKLAELFVKCRDYINEEETEKDKEFDKKFGKYANKPMSFDDFFNLSQEMRKFYEQ